MSENKLPKAENKAKNSKGSIFFSLILLALIIFLAVSGYLMINKIREEHKGIGDNIDRDDKTLQRLAGQIAEYQKQSTAIQTQLADIKTEVTNLESVSANKDESINKTLADFSYLQSEKLAANKKELLISIKQIKRQLSKTRGDWLIADAEYLLSIAVQRLHLLADFHTTIEAMEAANQRLRASGDAGVIKVREQLTKELSSLKAVKILDVVGVYAKIKVLSEKTENLDVLFPYEGKPHNNKPDTQSLKISGIALLDQALKNLKEFVEIRRTQQPVNAIISVENANFIRQQVKVKLQIAIIALVRGNEKLYQLSMSDVRSWVEKNFTLNNKTQDFVAEIVVLQNIPLHNQLPDIGLSLKMLRDISKLQIEADKALSTKVET